jgi:radical SAM protein with 4Fe4S-binding SPASM domain
MSKGLVLRVGPVHKSGSIQKLSRGALTVLNNLYLTFLCNNRCPYCFLTGKLRHDAAECSPEDFISIESARIAADFFRHDTDISFLGGEPTLHPKFREIADIFIDMGFKIFLFSNGRFESPVREYLSSSDRIFPVFNINHPASYPPDVWETIELNLEALKEKINSLAINIYRVGQETGYLLELVRRYGVKAVKIALAAPAGSGPNECVPFSERHRLALPLVELVEQLGEESVITYGECEKLKPCMLDSSLKDRMVAAGWRGAVYINRQCRTGGNMDIAPDLTIWRCLSFPESMEKKITDFDSPEAMRTYASEMYDHLLFDRYPSTECIDCPFARRRECEGGCMVRKILPAAGRNR